MKGMICALAIAAAAFARGGVEIHVPATGNLPTYFSGTNCRAIVSASVTPPSLAITKWELWIGGELTDHAEIPMPPRGPYLAQINPRVMFDSSHFIDGNSVQIKLKVWVNDDVLPHESSAGATAYNKAAIFGIGEFELDNNKAGATETNVQFGYLGIKFPKWLKSDAAWNQTHVATRLSDASAWYINAHGDPGRFYSNSLADPRFAEPPNTPNVLSTRETAVGTGAPPFNSGVPPVSVAFLYVCCSGADEMGHPFLHPEFNAYTGTLEDQAFVGSYNDVQSAAAKDTAEAFWGSLRQGNTVEEACKSAFDAYKAATDDITGYVCPEFWYQVFTIVGDPNTRLTNRVYTGNDDYLGIIWWRKL